MDPSVAAQALAGGGVGGGLQAAAAAVLVLGYFYIFWDKRKDESSNKDDGQAGIKIVLFTIILFSLGMAAGAVDSLLGWLLSGAKGGAGPIKASMGPLVAGGGGVALVLLMLLPRTNNKDYPQAERFATGAVGLVAIVTAIGSLNGLLDALLTSKGWRGAGALQTAHLLVSGGLGFFALTRFGGMSGWTAPAKPAPMMQQGGYQPQAGYQQQAQMQGQQQGGYQQPQQGYPPQQQGYPPQGGMPPGGQYPQGGGGQGGGQGGYGPG